MSISGRTQGEWNAWVEAAIDDPDEFKRRGEQVPESIRDGVRRHIRTVRGLKRRTPPTS